MNIDFGAKFKECRKKMNLSIAALAEKSGVSPGMISQIERNTTVPSIYIFWKLCNALEQNVSEFFEETTHKHNVNIVRAGKHRVVSGAGNKYYLLTPQPDRRIEMYKVAFKNSDNDQICLDSHDGAECGYVISGALKVITDAEEYVLYPGDSIYFESNIMHYLQNNGDEEECVAVWAEIPFTW